MTKSAMEESPIDCRERISAIKAQVLNLDEKIDEITGLLGPSSFDEPPSSVFIYGDAGTGKTLTLTKCLGVSNFVYAFIDCTESYSMKLVYESILNQIAGHKLSIENNFQPYAKCSNMLEFVLSIQKISQEKQFGQENNRSVIIVFDKCEKLRLLNKNIVPALVKLRELSGLKLCVVFVSTLPWSQFYTFDHVTQPITVFFSQYEQKQLFKILMLQKPESVTTALYESFLNLFLSLFFNATHDVRELLYQASLSFSHYYEPIQSGELSVTDTAQLWKRSQPFFKKALRSLYLKIDCNMELSEVENITSVSTQALIMELPYYSKYILIGSYIASYNPATEDKRMFLKNHGKHRKSTKAKTERTKHHLIGPKPFALQRLFAIVSAILNDQKFNLNADLFIEVGSLVQMKLLTQISEDILDGPTFKCNVGLQFIDVISRNVQFPIRKYLVDFLE